MKNKLIFLGLLAGGMYLGKLFVDSFDGDVAPQLSPGIKAAIKEYIIETEDRKEGIIKLINSAKDEASKNSYNEKIKRYDRILTAIRNKKYKMDTKWIEVLSEVNPDDNEVIYIGDIDDDLEVEYDEDDE